MSLRGHKGGPNRSEAITLPRARPAIDGAALIAKQRAKLADLDARIGRLMTARVDAEERLAVLLARHSNVQTSGG